VSRERSGSASGVLAIVRTFGQCLGAAIVGIILAVYAGRLAGNGVLNALQDAQAMRLAIGMAAVAAGLAGAVSIGRIRRQH
jgi:DHA2 family multidrug resistance protein-like MFS transporter